MIDRRARTRLAEGIRHLVSGLITNDEFEDIFVLDSDDPAILEIFHEAWLLYSDMEEHRLVGRRRMPREAKREIARWIVFLASDREYEWPVHRGWSGLCFDVANLLTLGFAERMRRRASEREAPVELWPFRRHPDYQAALKAWPFRSS